MRLESRIIREKLIAFLLGEEFAAAEPAEDSESTPEEPTEAEEAQPENVEAATEETPADADPSEEASDDQEEKDD